MENGLIRRSDVFGKCILVPHLNGAEAVMESDLYEIPAVDAVEVVRCRECVYYKESELLGPNKFCFRLKDRDGKPIGYNFADDDFCSRGQRREDGDA